jgi:hypothetical protein
MTVSLSVYVILLRNVGFLCEGALSPSVTSNAFCCVLLHCVDSRRAIVLNRKLEVFPEEVVTSEQFRSGTPPNITITREEVEACFIGDGKTTIFQILKILRNLSEKLANSDITVA